MATTSLSALSLCGCSSDGTTNNNPNGSDASTGSDGAGSGGARPDAPGETGSDSGSCKFDYTNYQPQAAPLTLKADILPVIARGCALSSSCHKSGSTYPPDLGPGYVDGGPVATDAVLATINASLSMASTEARDWIRVKKSDPEHSYVMRKLDGSQGCGDLTCVVVSGSPKPCGERMPGGDSSLPLDPDELKMFRDWIKQGAN